MLCTVDVTVPLASGLNLPLFAAGRLSAVVCSGRVVPARMCEADDRSARLERARLRHADTERTLSPRPPREASEAATFRRSVTGAKVVGERPWSGPSTRQSDDVELNWEPMAPPPRRFETGDLGFTAVFGLLAIYAVIGAAVYAGGVAGALLVLRQALGIT